MINRSNSPYSELHTVQLNGFVRRTQNTKMLKALIGTCDGKLSRKGRSRNWCLEISLSQSKRLLDLIYQGNEPSWLWLAKLLSELKFSQTAEILVEIVSNDPNITVSKLMSMTACSASEARNAIDLIEWT